MNISAVIVTRGNVDLTPVLNSLPPEWEQVVWNNAGSFDGEHPTVMRTPPRSRTGRERARFTDLDLPDQKVFGRYLAIGHARGELIYVQDDDCIVSDPHALVETWQQHAHHGHHAVVNMPEPWNSNPFYEQHALVGFGAVFHRDAPARAFRRAIVRGGYPPGEHADLMHMVNPSFLRTCDIVFTYLTPTFRVQVPHESLPFAYHDDRMWRHPNHQEERQRMLDLCARIDDDMRVAV